MNASPVFQGTAILWLIVGVALLGSMLGCGGGGNGNGNQEEKVSISGVVDDGTDNSPIRRAECEFRDLNNILQAAPVADSKGAFTLKLSPDTEGFLRCHPPGIPNLTLSTFLSTKEHSAGDVLSGEDVDPARTLVADIIDTEKPSVRQARKLELLSALDTDPDLKVMVAISTGLFNVLLEQSQSYFGTFSAGGGEGGGGGTGGDGGGVGGSAGDGGVTSPIAKAECRFIAGKDPKTGRAVHLPALSDFADDGEMNRPDLLGFNRDMQDVLSQYDAEEIRAAFAAYFPQGYGATCEAVANAEGEFRIATPPDLPGFIVCTPPNQDKLILATYVAGRPHGEDLPGQDVNPATTVFSTNIATRIGGDLETIKDNFIRDIEGLEVYIQQTQRDGSDVLFFSLCAPEAGAAGPPASCAPSVEENDVSMVAFTATSLFNSFYKNHRNGDFLAALADVTATGSIDPAKMVTAGMSVEQADELKANVDTAADDLVTGLGLALSRARINVTVTDTPGGTGISGASVGLVNLPPEVSCDNCPGGTYDLPTDGKGQVTFRLSGVPGTAIEIALEAFGVAGYKETAARTEITSFATVSLEIAMEETQKGSLRVVISPAAAASAGAQWRVDGVNWYDSGFTLSDLPAGNYEVEFKPVSGYSTPAKVAVSVADNRMTSTIVTYYPITDPTKGSLTVTIEPPEAVSAGARWRVDGGTWHPSGFTQTDIPTGTHQVDFEPITDWSTPPLQPVSITSSQTAAATGTYTRDTGSLTVTIQPAEAVPDGRWRVDGGTWHPSGFTQTGIPTGSYQVEFGPIDGWIPPDPQAVVIVKDQTASTDGTYQSDTGELRVTIEPGLVRDMGAQWQVDGGEWHASGYLMELPTGIHDLEFSMVPGWIEPVRRGVTINRDQLTEERVSYTEQDERLILYLPFAEDTRDYSGFDNHAQDLHGESAIDETNQALTLKGEQMLTVGIPKIFLEIRSYTLMAWIWYTWDGHPDGEEWRQEIMERFGYFWMNVQKDTGGLRVGFRSNRDCKDGIDRIRMDSVATIPEARWTHVAATFDYGTQSIAIFIDGKPAEGSYIEPLCGEWDGSHIVTIGGRDADPAVCPACPDGYFNGQISDLRIYGDALSANDIAAVFNGR